MAEYRIVTSLHYRVLAKTCMYCSAVPSHIRVTMTLDGDPSLATLCEVHARGEEEASTSDLVNTPGTSNYHNPNITVTLTPPSAGTN